MQHAACNMQAAGNLSNILNHLNAQKTSCNLKIYLILFFSKSNSHRLFIQLFSFRESQKHNHLLVLGMNLISSYRLFRSDETPHSVKKDGHRISKV